MRVVIQRVLTEALVKVNDTITGKIDKGFVILLGVEETDEQSDIDWLSNKIAGLRIFNDDSDKMNLSIKDINGQILLISQFTLHASTKKGNRPSFIKAAKPEFAKQMYEAMAVNLRNTHNLTVETGIFGADMKVRLINDGPVTICMDSKARE